MPSLVSLAIDYGSFFESHSAISLASQPDMLQQRRLGRYRKTSEYLVEPKERVRRALDALAEECSGINWDGYDAAH